MSKRVFFSFHYQDVIDFRANVVRNHRVTKDNQAGYFDASVWETAKRTSKIALKKLINNAIYNTSTTCVLIGSGTYEREWVRYEIFRSIYRGSKIFGIHINKVKDKYQRTKKVGLNPFDYLGVYFNNDATKFAFTEYKNGSWYYWEEINSTRWFKNTYFSKSEAGKNISLSKYFRVYDWIDDNGYNNFSKWIES